MPKYAGEALTESLDDLRADLASVPPAFGAWLGTRLAGSVPRPSGRRPHGGGPPAVRTLWLVTGATSDGSPTRYRRAG
ncbi:hypothetical protein, partial [Actinophytocola sp.]|uniref:hypothetical protein n=1 Tax=Actinophytocola sp. TaxID=1872138 RepID=UPI003D6ADA48